MVRLTQLFISLLLGFIALPAISSTDFSLQTSRTTVSPYESFQVDFVFSGINYQPRLDGLTIQGFQILGQSTSSSMSIVNGQQSNTFRLSYQLKAEGEGDFKIGPYRVKIGNETLVSNELGIKVSKSAMKNSESPVLIEASVSNKNPWSGEQVLYKLKIYRPRQLAGISNLKYELPSFEGFIAEEDMARKLESTEQREGVLYQVVEIQVPLTAVKTGASSLEPAKLSYYTASRRRGNSLFSSFFNDDFFAMNGKRNQVFSEPLELKVKGLPKNAQGEFDGLVGKYVIDAELSHQEIKVGENLTLSLKVTGLGSLQDWKGVELELPGFKVYPDGKGELEKKRTKDGFVGGVKTFKYALVPTRAGEFQLKPFQLRYFDPESGQFQQARSKPMSLKILPSDEEIVAQVFSSTPESSTIVPTTQKQKIKANARDILPIQTFQDEEGEIRLSTGVWLSIYGLTLLLGLGMEKFWKNSQSLLADPIQVNYRRAAALWDQEKDEQTLRAFFNLVQRRLKREVRELTVPQLCEILENEPDLVSLKEEINQALMKEEEARYGATGSQLSLQDWDKLGLKLIEIT